MYPGALQLASFLGMNLTRGDKESAEAHRLFYDEYLAVCDLSAAFYLQTIRSAFYEQSIAAGSFEHHGRRLGLVGITKTAFMVTEGERDGISAPGQALAALT